MPTARVVAVAPESPAARAGLLPGDELRSLNGEELRDVIRYHILADEPVVELEVARGGLERSVLLEKRAGEPLGLELASAVFDRVRTCDNHCPFCFIYQLPAGMRRSLSVKDDDFRLSFLYGNFTTLTRFTEADLERVVSERLSPLYVSIHATDPELRARLLRNRRGATSLRWLGALLDADIEVHGQVVVCPGINDGDALHDTMLGVLDRFPRLASVGLVPLGVSAHSREPDLHPHTRADAAAVLDAVDAWQSRFLDALGRRMVFAADEYHLLAGRPVPAADAYEGFPQHENGIGMARAFTDSVLAALDGRKPHDAANAPDARHKGFFGWVDGAPASGYRAPRGTGDPVAFVSRTSAPLPVAIVTGEYGASVLAPLVPALARHAQVPVRVLVVPNRFFGGNIAVTGLLTGADLRAVLAMQPAGERYLLPDVVLSGGRFLDGDQPADLPRDVEIVPTDGAALVAALAGTRGVKPIVAVVGRPNVGKSTLVNRIVGRRAAIVEESPGVTRDRKELAADWNGREFLVVDTGGWLVADEQSPDPAALVAAVSRQAERAIKEADAVCFVVDATVGVTDEDDRVLRILRRSGKPVLVVANKVDDANREPDAWALTRLGFGEPFAVSALHGRGTGDLLDAVVAALPPEEAPVEEHDSGLFSVAIVGRPNVGKSTLFNHLVGDERAVVHDMPGTTRDSVDTVVETDEGPLRFIDTAGMRRRSRIDEPVEYFGLVRALESVDRADAALLVIDAGEGVTHQDQRLAERIDAAGCAIVIVLNKWDLLDAEARARCLVDVGDRLAFLSYAPVLKVSAKSGKNMRQLLPALREAERAYHRRVPTAALNKVLLEAQRRHPPPAVRRHRPRVLYATQGAADPPTFTLFTTHELPATYLRYLERSLREAFDLGPTPVKLRVRRRPG